MVTRQTGSWHTLIRAWGEELWSGLTSLLFPSAAGCALCQRSPLPAPSSIASAITPSVTLSDLSSTGLCPECLQGVFLSLDAICQTCGKPQPGISGLCGDCWSQGRPFAQARAVGAYMGPLKEAIHRFKYGGARHLAQPLGALMAYRLHQALPPPDVVVPVPLHPRKLRQRGFNQAELLAREICLRQRLPLASDALIRCRSTGAQSRLRGADREVNVSRAFMVPVPQEMEGKVVLLIDDIYTTGATASACAEALLAAGARRVDVLTLALGLAG